MAQSKIFELPIRGKSPLTFSQINQLKNWLNDELDFWGDKFKGQGFRSLDNYLFRIQEFVDSIDGGLIGKKRLIFEAVNEDLLNRINEYFDGNEGGFLNSEGKTGAIVSELILEGSPPSALQEVYQSYLHPSNGININGTNIRVFSSFWSLYHQPNAASLMNVTHAMSSATERAKQSTETANRSFAASKAWFEKWRAETLRRQDITVRWYANRAKRFMENQSDLHIFQRKSAQNEFESLITTYESHLQLKAPAKYWSTKAKLHNKSRYIYLAFIAGFIGVSYLLFKALSETIFPKIVGLGPEVTFVQASPYWATILLSATAIMWVGRILVRLFLSEHHLKVKCEEKRMIITTYLALMDKEHVGTKEKSILLDAILSPTTDGIVKDDSAPPIGLHSILSKQNT